MKKYFAVFVLIYCSLSVNAQVEVSAQYTPIIHSCELDPDYSDLNSYGGIGCYIPLTSKSGIKTSLLYGVEHNKIVPTYLKLDRKYYQITEISCLNFELLYRFTFLSKKDYLFYAQTGISSYMSLNAVATDYYDFFPDVEDELNRYRKTNGYLGVGASYFNGLYKFFVETGYSFWLHDNVWYSRNGLLEAYFGGLRCSVGLSFPLPSSSNQ